jgi:hypothetical protein
MNKRKRLLAFLICMVMCMSLLPVSALAEDGMIAAADAEIEGGDIGPTADVDGSAGTITSPFGVIVDIEPYPDDPDDETEELENTVVMTADEFIDCLKIALARKTRYDNVYPRNIGYYDGTAISWDCWNLGKTIIWTRGSIVNNYTAGTIATVDTSCGLGDWVGSKIIEKAPNCSSDFSKLVPGEWLYLPGHMGYYIGDGQVIECTQTWGTDGVTQSQIDSYGTRSRDGENGGYWLYHGKVPWIDYDAEEPTVSEPCDVCPYPEPEISAGLCFRADGQMLRCPFSFGSNMLLKDGVPMRKAEARSQKMRSAQGILPFLPTDRGSLFRLALAPAG